MMNHGCLTVILHFCILWITLLSGSSLVASADALKAAASSNRNNFRDCIHCDRSSNLHIPINSTSRSHPYEDSNLNKVLPEESEKVIFSQKYSPEAMTTQDGFVPIPGPYVAKSARQARTYPYKPVFSGPQRQASAPQSQASARNFNTALNHAQSRHHGHRGVGDLNSQQDLQRRVQYRHPKAIEDLTVRESIASEDILGNGHFEILKGGIFSEEERNEIIGSRRMARGFGSFGAPVFLEQSRFNPIQSVQFPPVYHRRGRNQFNPLFYPRAPF